MSSNPTDRDRTEPDPQALSRRHFLRSAGGVAAGGALAGGVLAATTSTPARRAPAPGASELLEGEVEIELEINGEKRKLFLVAVAGRDSLELIGDAMLCALFRWLKPARDGAHLVSANATAAATPTTSCPCSKHRPMVSSMPASSPMTPRSTCRS